MTAESTERRVFGRMPGSVVVMGFNPFRQHERTALDIAMVVGAIALMLGAVVWAVFGG